MILDHGRIDVVLSRFLLEHRVGQGGLVALLAVAFGALIITRLSSGGADLTPSSVQIVGSPSPSATVTVVPTQTPAPAAPTAPVPSGPTPTEPAPTLVPSDVSPSPDSTDPPAAPSAEPSTYTIKQGDTLSAIAGRLGTTWQVLAELNGIDDPSRLRVGQTLALP